MIRQILSEIKRGSPFLWSADVGRMHWRNNILVSGNRIFVSASGQRWNKPDERDGLYCLDLNSGHQLWFCPTDADANEVALFDNILLVGTDRGKVISVLADTGVVLQEIGLRDPVYTKAIQLQTSRGKVAIIVSRSGEVVRYSFESNEFTVLGEIPHKIRANPVAIAPDSFLVASESGAAILVQVEPGRIDWKILFQVDSHRSSAPYSLNLQIKSVSSIVVLGDRVILSYVRNTYDRRPPMVCFSLSTGEKIWDAGHIQSESTDDSSTFGNSRVAPAIWNNLVLSTFSYNESVHAFSLETGKWMWRLRLDDSYFQNWSSPIVRENCLYVARINGVLSVVDLIEKKVLTSYSIEILSVTSDNHEPRMADDISETFSPAERGIWPRSRSDLRSAGPYPSDVLVAGICSTPVVLDDKILVGTVSGYLRCIRRDQP